jgi:FMN phosphatase YigB (HAD superfamily)
MPSEPETVAVPSARREEPPAGIAKPSAVGPGPISSFDVFDTVLTRAVGRAQSVFLLLGQQVVRDGVADCTPEIFARARAEAEARAVGAIRGHPPLRRIHLEVCRALGLRAEVADRLVEMEISLERAILRPVPPVVELVEEARAGGPVIFVSDTSHPAEQLRTTLREHGVARSGDPIFASCECDATKSLGMMYPYVARVLGRRPSEFHHHGDDPIADMRNGRLSGWRVSKLPEARLNRFERALEAHSYATGGLSSVMAGASRLARLRVRPQTPRARAQVDVASGVMAPLLTGWVLWTMREARRSGIRRLYFISRDGQVLIDIARRLEEVVRTGLELRYLHGSRRAFMLASRWDRVVTETARLDHRTLEEFAEVFDIAWDRLASAAGAVPGRNLSGAELDRLADSLRSGMLAADARAGSAGARRLLHDYLRQEGFGDGVASAIVDVGWRGMSAKALLDAIEGSGLVEPARFYYFGLGDDAFHVTGPALAARMDSWFFNCARGTGYAPPPTGFSSLIEMFCAADHGTTTGYERRGAHVVPQLSATPSAEVAWGLPLLRSTIHSFVEEFARVVEAVRVDPWVDVSPAVRDVAYEFWLRPTAAEARHWSTFPHATDIAHRNLLPLAEPIGLLNVLRVLRGGRLRSQQSWGAGTAMISPWIFRAALLLGWRLRDELRSARRRLAWAREQMLLLRPRRDTTPHEAVAGSLE